MCISCVKWCQCGVVCVNLCYMCISCVRWCQLALHVYLLCQLALHVYPLCQVVSACVTCVSPVSGGVSLCYMCISCVRWCQLALHDCVSPVSGGDRWRDVPVGHPGHGRSGGVQCNEGPVHEDWGGVPYRVCHRQHEEFRGYRLVQRPNQTSQGRRRHSHAV